MEYSSGHDARRFLAIRTSQQSPAITNETDEKEFEATFVFMRFYENHKMQNF